MSHAALKAEGEPGGPGRVGLMREMGTEGGRRRCRRTVTATTDGEARPAPDLLNRDFSALGGSVAGYPTSRSCPCGAGRLHSARDWESPVKLQAEVCGLTRGGPALARISRERVRASKNRLGDDRALPVTRQG